MNLFDPAPLVLIHLEPEQKTITRLRMYKTAWSPDQSQYIEIVEVQEDVHGEPILVCRIGHTTVTHLFRPEELTNYVL